MKNSLLLSLSLTATAAAHPQIDPTPRSVVPNVSVRPFDLDGDGHSELVGRSFDRILRSYHVDGQGRLIDATDLTAPAPTGDDFGAPTAQADLDGDGLIDLVGFGGPFSPQGADCVVWYNLGGGLFAPAISIATIDYSVHPQTIASADFDGDGDIDLLLYLDSSLEPGQNFGREVFVVQNLGGGQFSAPSSAQSSNERFFSVRPGDIDADGDLDFVAVAALTDELTILRATGGQLQVEPVPVSLPLTVSTELVDADQDGVLDVVAQTIPVIGADPPTVLYLYRGTAAGALQAPVLLAGSQGLLGDVYALADVNGDGSVDIVASPTSPDAAGLFGLEVMVGDGAGQFAAPVRSGLGTTAPRRLLVADANGDGRDDILSREVVQVPLDPDIRSFIRLSTVSAPVSDATFSGPISIEQGSLQPVQAAGDLNSDGVADLVGTLEDSINPAHPRIIWSEGTVDSDQFVFSGDVGLRGSPELVADFNGSAPAGVGILVRGSDLSPDLYLVQATASGQFLAPVAIGPDTFGALAAPTAIDWDGDGDLDLIGASSVGSVLQWMEQTAPMTFAPAATLHAPSLSNAIGASYLTGDFNGDSIPDAAILTSTFFSQVFSWRLGLGGGVLGAEVLAQSVPQLWIIDDFDDDGFDDVAWLSSNPNRVMWVRGGPSGLDVGSPQTLIASLQGNGRLARVDFDGDSDLDIIVLDQNDGSIFGHANLGGGSYSAASVPVASATPVPIMNPGRDLLVVDAGGDGDLDLLTKDGLWRRNLSNGVRGDSYCDAATANSSGAPGRILAVGSTAVAEENLQLRAYDLPPLSFGYFLTSQTASGPMGVPGSSGLICLGGAVGRYSAPSQIQFSNLNRQFNLELDLSQMATPNGLIQALPGSTWNFQAWFRDTSPMGATSNFTDAVAVGFQ